MENTINFSELVDKNLLSEDYEIISSHNNLILRSQSERTVARIGRLSQIEKREDPGDIGYSHAVAWEASKISSALKPITKEPIIYHDVIISKYPLLKVVDEWRMYDPMDIFNTINSFNSSLNDVNLVINIVQLDVSLYAQARLDYVRDREYRGNEDSFNYVQNLLELHSRQFPFIEMTETDPALVHGDLHSGNIVLDNNNIRIIDLDSAARGPRLYDLASWRFRQELGDAAPIALVAKEARRSYGWSEESYRALIAWKALSSMTHILRYEPEGLIKAKILKIGEGALRAGGLFGEKV